MFPEALLAPEVCVAPESLRDDVCSPGRFRAGTDLRAGGRRAHGCFHPAEGVQEGQDTAKLTSCGSDIGEAPQGTVLAWRQLLCRRASTGTLRCPAESILENMALPEPVLEICGIEYVVSLTHRSLCGCLVRQVLLTAYPRCPPRLSRENGPCKTLCKTSALLKKNLQDANVR